MPSAPPRNRAVGSTVGISVGSTVGSTIVIPYRAWEVPLDLKKLEEFLRRTLDDGRLSRGERRALQEIFLDVDLEKEQQAAFLNRSFLVARDAIAKLPEQEVLTWLLSLSKTLVKTQNEDGPSGRRAEVYFEPKDDCAGVLRELIRNTERSLRICVFTMTDNRITEAVLSARRRGVAVRIISDDDKSTDRGSDIWRLVDEGLAVRLDQLPDHMHHKFAVFDEATAVTGSYNWTRGAAEKNHENILVTDDPRLVKPFIDEFERLWEQFEDAN